MRRTRGGAIAALGVVWLIGCASAPETQPEKLSMTERADRAVSQMAQRDPSLSRLLAESAGYVVFPSIGEDGLDVGKEQATGVVYDPHRGPIGTATLEQVSRGEQVGGRGFTEIIVLKTPRAMRRLRRGDFELTSAQATVLSSGAAADSTPTAGTSVFIGDEFNLMARAEIGDQRIDFEPLT